MDTETDRVRRYVRARREEFKWSQSDLAKAAGNLARSTVQNLEDGKAVREGKESAIETALGWEIGSLDEIRAGGRPIAAESFGKALATMSRTEIFTAADREPTTDAAVALINRWKGARDAEQAKLAKTAEQARHDATRKG